MRRGRSAMRRPRSAMRRGRTATRRPHSAWRAARAGARAMSFYGTFLRRNFEPVILSVQDLVDLFVVLLACWLGYVIGLALGGIGKDATLLYKELSALIAAVCLVTFHTFGMYSP